MTSRLAHEFAQMLKREDFVARHHAAVVYKKEKRAATVQRIPEWGALRARASALKAQVRRDLDGLLSRFMSVARANGVRVHFAKTAADANEHVLRIARSKAARRVVKSKSMTTEECGLNPFLERHDIEITDTDLGERIVQLFGEPPSHIVTPAIHRSRREIGELFAAHGLVEPGEEDPHALTMAARASLRRLFLDADLGITGANFLVAETGTVVVVENEANSLLGTSLPRVHVVVAGIEKLIERVSDLGTFLTLLAPSSSGQRLTTYTTHYTGPQAATDSERAAGLPDHELHVILIDNGRTALLGTPAEEALACIRCGACLNVCPVYRRVGGHAYSYVYQGPIGKVLGPGLAGPSKADLAKASSLCGACTEVCPVGIDLSRHIHEWRAELRSRGSLDASLPPGMGFAMRNPDLWRAATSVLRRTRWISGPLLRKTKWLRDLAGGGRRRVPEVPRRTFRSWWRDRTERFPHVLEIETEAEAAPAASAEANPAPSFDLRAGFEAALVEAGGEPVSREDLPSELVATRLARDCLASGGREVPLAPVHKRDLNGLPWLVATGRWCIARKGAVWVDLRDLETRAQLLLAEGLVLMVPSGALVADLPEHYARLAGTGLPACGTLVSGPSKTADIEQTLVMGAHGPRRLLVCLV